MTIKEKSKIILISSILGIIVGIICWLFLTIMELGITLIWDTVPNHISFYYYPIVICLISGILIGICQKKLGDYPQSMEQLMKKIKNKEKIEPKDTNKVFICSLLPLIFGASIGPEAALTNIIINMCTWISEKFKYIKKELSEIKQISISAALSIIFASPLYGLAHELESDEKTIGKNKKIIIYLITILSGIGIFILLQKVYPCLGGIYKFNLNKITNTERLYLVPLTIIGFISGLFYFITNKVIKKIIKPINNYHILKGIIGGVALGSISLVIPYTMFSGEAEIELIMQNYSKLSFSILLLIGIGKIFITNLCIHTGFKGGHIFPIIFSGVALGLAFATIFPLNPIYIVMIITTSFVSTVMQKPLATAMLLILCFPLDGFILMLTSAVIACALPVPEKLAE